MTKLNDIANFFLHLDAISDGEGISNLKMQKLMYYAQGCYVALYKKPLFENEIEAWMHGPVVPELYHQYKQYGSNPIPYNNEEWDLTKKETDLLAEVFQVFGQYSAWKLREITHKESPWTNHEKNIEEIPIDEIKQYFQKHYIVNDDKKQTKQSKRR